MDIHGRIKEYAKQIQLARKIEAAKEKFAQDLDKHAARHLRNQGYIEELKRLCNCADPS